MSIETGNNKLSRKELGAIGEQIAASYLSNVLGWHVIVRNWRCRSGEIDIVAHHHGFLVLIEVRSRHDGGQFGTAVESVDKQKLRQMKRVGNAYIALEAASTGGLNVRFDLIAIQFLREVAIDIQHFRNITG